MRWAALALAALALSGCETTAEKSAGLEKQAKLAAAHRTAAQRAATVTRASSVLRVLSATLVKDSEGAAAVLRVRNGSARAQRAVPVAIVVGDAAGRTLYENETAGAETALVTIPFVPARGEAVWVDDQVPATGSPASVRVLVGEGSPLADAAAQPAVSGLHAIEDPANGPGAAGTVSNRSSGGRGAVVVDVLALRGGRVVAAGRSVLPELPASASQPFQAFLVGDARSATLQASASVLP